MTNQQTRQQQWNRSARRWWNSLQDTQKGGDRAALARLRRVAMPMEALEEPAVFELYKSLGFGKSENEIGNWLPRVAIVAAVLAHIKEDATPSESGFRRRFAEILGHGGERPLMSPLRFKRLLSTAEDRDLLIAFRRAVALAGGRNIDVGDVAASLLDWSERRRMRWAFDYYGAGIAAPKQSQSASDKDED
jgi:CRISPR system Cascade subunit CasB